MGLTRRCIGEQRTFTETELPEHLLQHELIDVLQMGFQAKQAQWSLWNQDSSLSRTLSDLSHSCLSWADDIVRAIARLGTAPDGRATTVSSSSNMINLEPAWRKTQRCQRWRRVGVGHLPPGPGSELTILHWAMRRSRQSLS